MGIESNVRPVPTADVGGEGSNGGQKRSGEQYQCFHFQMPVHYPRYTKAEYETMPEWQLDRLLGQYGLPIFGDINQKRRFAIGTFLWSS